MKLKLFLIQSRVARFSRKSRLLIGLPLAVFGFVYQVVGAWVLWSQDYPFAWQTETARHGYFLVWSLFIMSLAALVIGGIMLYVDSIEYQKGHP